MTRRADSFNPKSSDAMFATILERLEQQDRDMESHHSENKEKLEEIVRQTTATNGRVTKLENWRMFQKGYTAAIALAVSIVGTFAAWLLRHFFGH